MTPNKRMPTRPRGMTLIEMVVALSLLSMLVLIMGASLRSMGQSAERIDERVDKIDEVRVVSAFLRELLSRATWLRDAKTGQPLYAATQHSLIWVGSMPARHGLAGRHFFRLALEPAPQGPPSLVLRYTPWVEGSYFPDWSQATARVLVPMITDLQMAYGGAGLGAGWALDWAVPDELPPRMRLTLATASQAWPPMVIPVRALEPRPRPSFGGGSRR